MVHGDFNVNYFSDKDSSELKSRLEESLDFQQVVKKPTFISRSLLDDVYVKLGKFKNVTTAIISVYYSDHDTVRISFKFLGFKSQSPLDPHIHFCLRNRIRS